MAAASDEAPSYNQQLLAACKRNNLQLLEEVLEEHAAEIDVNCVDGTSNSCLHWAANYGHTAAMQTMLRAGTDPNIRNFQGDTALHKAFFRNDMSAVRMLMQAGAKIDVVNEQGMKPGDYAQSAEARQLNEQLINAAQPGLVRLAPRPPDRRSRARSDPNADPAPLDLSHLPGMAVAEEDADGDGEEEAKK